MAAPCRACIRSAHRPPLQRCVFVWLFLTLCSAAASYAEVIDRIVAVVEGRIITLSDLRQERENRALLGEQAIEDNATLARQLADTYLIEQQIGDYPNIDVTEADIDADLEKVRLRQPNVPDALRDAVRRRIRMQKFFDVRFRQLIRPTDDEIRRYYDEVFVPEARKRGLQSIPPLTDGDMAAAIRENVIQERLDHDLELWLEAIRRRSNVEVFQ